MRVRLIAALLVSLWAMHLASAVGEAPPWKGAESMSIVSLLPDLDRCGEPPVLLARFAGDGIDARFGAFTVVASGCLNPETLQVFDLEATDTFLSGDSVLIAPDDATLSLDPQTCVATNVEPVPFDVAGGTGSLANATGGGTFDIALNWTPCNGLALPARVWFEGTVAP